MVMQDATDTEEQHIEASPPPYTHHHIKRDQMFQELAERTDARVSRIETDFVNGFRKISQYADTVTIFGSARLTADDRYYQKAVEVSTMLAEEGYTVITGGGGGIMEAGNRGAFEAGGKSIGFNILLPQEQDLNPYTTDAQTFRYFFSRKVMLAFAAQAYLFFPGGFGTLDEFFEIITLIQTHKIEPAPVILVGKDFWQPLDNFVHEYLLEGTHTISPGDEKLYTITDDLEVIKQLLDEHEKQQLIDIFNGVQKDD